MHLVLGDSGRVALPSTEGSPKEQAMAVKQWMHHSETAMSAAIGQEGLPSAWRSCARLAAGGAAKAKDGTPTPRKQQTMTMAGVMLGGVITKLQPLSTTLPKFAGGSPSLPKGGITLVSNGRRSKSVFQTAPLIAKHIRMPRFATPRHMGWGFSKVLTKRSKDDLATQFAFASDQRGSGSQRLFAEGGVNPAYVENMMGFPTGWTKGA